MIILTLLGLVLGFIAIEIVWLVFSGSNVPAPKVSRETVVLGNSGETLSYLVLGDSTAAGQGGDYQAGIAQSTANHLAENHKVSFVNLAVPGARAKDVETEQLPKALAYKPDVVLVAVGANDVTHLTKYSEVQKSIKVIANKLIQQNCSVKIILTGSPDMGTPPRLPQPLRYIAGRSTYKLNAHLDATAQSLQISRARVAEGTGAVFRQNHALFAADKFHPNNAGYDYWKPILNTAIDEALAHQPSHCE